MQQTHQGSAARSPFHTIIVAAKFTPLGAFLGGFHLSSTKTLSLFDDSDPIGYRGHQSSALQQ